MAAMCFLFPLWKYVVTIWDMFRQATASRRAQASKKAAGSTGASRWLEDASGWAARGTAPGWAHRAGGKGRLIFLYSDGGVVNVSRALSVSPRAPRVMAQRVAQFGPSNTRNCLNEMDMVLLPQGLKALKQVAKQVGLDLRGAYLNLDGGFDSAHNRKCIFHAGLIPNIKENPRNRKRPKRGRKRLFNATIHVLRLCVERTFAWEDKFKRLLLRFERIQRRHYGMKLLAYTLINLRKFCGT